MIDRIIMNRADMKVFTLYRIPAPCVCGRKKAGY